MAEISRDEIDRLANRLEELERTVPERAGAFHSLLPSVLQKVKIRTPVHAWRLLRSPDLNNRIREAKETVALGERLAELLGECDSLLERVHAVEDLVRSCPDPAVSRAADSHLAPQRKALLLIGTGIDSLEAIEPAQQRIDELRGILDRVSRAVPLFSEAIQIHRRLTEAGDLGSAAIAADLKQWRAEFLNGPQRTGWVEEVSRALDAHRARLVAKRPEAEAAPPPLQPPPAPSSSPRVVPGRESVTVPERTAVPSTPKAAAVVQRYSLAEIEDQLSETREWANAMTGDIEQVRPLADRKRAIEADSTDVQAVNELGDAVREFRDRLKREAAEKIARDVTSFTSWIGIYAEKCGSHPELAALVETLQGNRLELPEDYSDFEENFNKAQSRFRGRINNDQTRLHEALCASVFLLRDICQAALHGRRSVELHQKLTDLEKRIPSPPRQPAQPAMQSIQDLAMCLQLERELRSLQDQCLEQTRHIETRREDLTTRVERLHALAERLPELEISLTSIAGRLQSAGDWPLDAILDQYESEISKIDGLLTAAESAALSGAEKTVESLRKFFEAADLELSMFDTVLPVFDFSSPTEPMPDFYIDVMDRARTYERELRERLTTVIASVRQRLPVLVQQVREASTSRDSEVSGDNRVVASLLAEYDELPSADADIDTLTQLRLWVQQVEVFLYSIQRAKHNVQVQVDELISRLNRLRRQGGDTYYPRWVHRVEAIVTGVGHDNLPPDTASLQLAEARCLLDALERDALLRISEEVQAARSRVALEMKATRDPEFISKARMVLRELDRHGEHILPPPAIVRQLLLLNDRAARGSVR